MKLCVGDEAQQLVVLRVVFIGFVDFDVLFISFVAFKCGCRYFYCFFMLLSLVLMLCVVLNTDRDRILSGTPVVARRHNGPITAAISPAAARIKTLPLASATNAAV